MRLPLSLAVCLVALAVGPLGAAPPPNKNLPEAPGTGETGFIGPLADAYQRIDPAADGWPTETFSQAAGSILKHLHELPAEAVSTKATSTPLTLPKSALEITHDGSAFTVHRASTLPATTTSALTAEIKKLPFTQLETKIVGVTLGTDKTATTRVLVHAKDGPVQTNATWHITWDIPDLNTPVIRSISLASYELVTAKTTTPLLTDATTSVLGNDPTLTSQLLQPTDHWRARLPQNLGLDPVANHGLAIGDLDGDGLEDLYLCQQGGLPNRLYLQNPDGTLRDASAGSGSDFLDYSASALVVDLDNDGDRDLVVALETRVLFLDNDGSAKFELAYGQSVPSQTFSLAAADFDLDADLDVYACGYNPADSGSGAMGEPVPYHDARNGGASTLFRNDGNWLFEDATKTTGLDSDNTRFSFAASWEDYDNDGDPDLYVANDYGRNCLYRNDAGKFTNIAPQLGIEDASSGMSTSWGDFDKDGHMDLYVSNMFSSAGNRITYQPQFKKDLDPGTVGEFRRHARGNALFKSDGNGGFTDVSVASRTTMGRWAWGSGFADLDNDTNLDILVANGFISTPDPGDL